MWAVSNCCGRGDRPVELPAHWAQNSKNFLSRVPHRLQASANAFEILTPLKAALARAPVNSLVYETGFQWNSSFDPSSVCYLRWTEDISTGKVTQLPYILKKTKNSKARLPNVLNAVRTFNIVSYLLPEDRRWVKGETRQQWLCRTRRNEFKSLITLLPCTIKQLL